MGGSPVENSERKLLEKAARMMWKPDKLSQGNAYIPPQQEEAKAA